MVFGIIDLDFMNNYELVLIFKPELSSDEQKKVLTKTEKFLTTGSGKIKSQNDWGKKTFAYPISKLTEGLYWFLEFQAEPKLADELNKNLRLEDQVLRHLLIKI